MSRRPSTSVAEGAARHDQFRGFEGGIAARNAGALRYRLPLAIDKPQEQLLVLEAGARGALPADREQMDVTTPAPLDIDVVDDKSNARVIKPSLHQGQQHFF